MKCPKCGIEALHGIPECPGCGVIFAKLAKQKERAKKESEAVVAAAGESLPRLDPMRGRMIAAAIIAVWIVCFGLYYRRAVRVARERALKSDIRTRPTVMMRDPVTGDWKAVDVLVSPSRKKP